MWPIGYGIYFNICTLLKTNNNKKKQQFNKILLFDDCFLKCIVKSGMLKASTIAPSLCITLQDEN